MKPRFPFSLNAKLPLIVDRPAAARRGAPADRRVGTIGLPFMALAGLLAIGGCFDAEQQAAIEESNSILAPIFKQPSPADAAQWASDQYDADKRARGTALLANAPFGGEEPYLALYREYATDPFTNVRVAAARGLGRHGVPADVPLLTPMLTDKELPVRLEAAWALQRLHNPEAIEPLAERLDATKEFEPAVRAASATALGQYATNRSLQGLIEALADDHLLVTQSAYESLQTITGNLTLEDDRREWALWAAQIDQPFANRKDFTYPVFSREHRILDYVPFMPPVPNEEPGRPQGMPEIASAPDTVPSKTDDR